MYVAWGAGDVVLSPVSRAPERKGIDAWPDDLGVRAIPFERACSLGPGTPAEVRDALTYFLIVANTGVAHLTFGSPTTEVGKLRLATKAIRELCLTSFRESGISMTGVVDAHHRFWGDVEFARLLPPATDRSPATLAD